LLEGGIGSCDAAPVFGVTGCGDGEHAASNAALIKACASNVERSDDLIIFILA
jgi:hypothetical protein